MKITVNLETDAQEMREFFGLPNVRPLQDEMLQIVRGNMEKGVTGFDALKLMQPMLPGNMQSVETLQKAFWDAFTNAGSKAGAESKTSASEHVSKKEGSGSR
jgi:hypothetical protein